VYKRQTYSYANIPFYNKKGRIAMNDQTWQGLLSYYLEGAEKYAFSSASEASLKQEFYDEFKVTDLCATPTITAIHIDSSGTVRTTSKTVFSMYRQGDNPVITQEELSGDFTDIIVTLDNTLLLNAGVMGPHNGQLGSFIEKNGDPLITNLRRPVYINPHDGGWLISEFGHNVGQLTYHKKDSVEVIASLPGIYKTFWDDRFQRYLFSASQGMEGIYSVDKNGAQSRLVSFPPENGISDVDTVDFNGDGYLDLAIASGDNADYSNVPKSFHGIRIYLGDNKGGFTFSRFLALPGVTQVKWIDVDEDGKQDLVATCYFAENLLHSAIIYRYDTGDDQFIPYSIRNADTGRWLIMEKGDINQDGKPDIIIGSNIDGPTDDVDKQIQKWATESVDALILLSR